MELAEPADIIGRYSLTGTISDENYRVQVVEEGDNMLRCNCVHQCVVDTAFHLAQPRVEGRPPGGRHPGRYQLHEGSKIRYTWLDNDDEWQ